MGISLMLIAGAFCVVWQKKRKFNRINSFGIQQFSSYTKKVTGQLGDAFLVGIGYGCLLGGSLIWVVEHESK